jgi:uncharacterized RDD family membrane protein YckC
MPIPLQTEDPGGRKFDLRLVEDSPLFPSQANVTYLRQPAHLWQRAVAHVLDLGIVAGLSWVVSVGLAIVMVQGQASSFEGSALTMAAREALLVDLFGYARWAVFLGAFLWLTTVYFIGLLYGRSSTLGQALMGLELEAEGGGPPSFRQVSLRLGLSSLAFLSLGLLMLPGLARQDGRLATDYWSGTRLTRPSRRKR